MNRVLWVCILLIIKASPALPTDTFDRIFMDKTLRVDYFHAGTATNEIISLDQAYEQGVWAGSQINLVDTLNLGKYLVKVFDVATNQLIYSRGFASIYGEWETTQEAINEQARTFHESVLLPFPRRPVQVVVAKRDKWMRFQDIFSTEIDPASRFINREQRGQAFRVRTLRENGPPGKKVDFLILGDGYTREEMSKFRKDADRWMNVILNTEPFKANADRLNFRAIEVISEESGIDEPRKNIWKNTALGCSYNSFDSPRYVLTFENRKIRDIAAAAPYDFIYIMTNATRYGGGGIYNLYATGMTGVENTELDWHIDYMFTHEFGHSFAGLGDEYYSSSTSYVDFYPAGVEPTAPNVTALLDPGKLKWKSFVEADTPLPTPWSKVHYDSLDAVRRTWDRSAPGYYEKWLGLRKQQVAKMKAGKYADKVGAFEGAGYSAKGLYRPAIDCRMFSLSTVPFDPVCQQGIERVIRFHSE